MLWWNRKCQNTMIIISAIHLYGGVRKCQKQTDKVVELCLMWFSVAMWALGTCRPSWLVGATFGWPCSWLHSSALPRDEKCLPLANGCVLHETFCPLAWGCRRASIKSLRWGLRGPREICIILNYKHGDQWLRFWICTTFKNVYLSIESKPLF